MGELIYRYETLDALRCKKHPKYKAVRPPRAPYCPECVAIYRIKQGYPLAILRDDVEESITRT